MKTYGKSQMMKRLSRRLFLQESLLAAAAVSTGSSSRVVVAADEPKQSRSPNERLSVAVIGVRSRGGAHAKAFDSRDDCFLSYICDADSAIGERVSARFDSKPKFVQDMRRIFDDKSVDIVSIATPNHWHSLVPFPVSEFRRSHLLHV